MRKLLVTIVFISFCYNVFAVSKSRYEELELFNKVLYLVESQYYRKVDTTKLVEGAIKGMMETLDPHSAFLNKEFYKKMQNDTNGEFGGVGIEVTQKDGIVFVVTPIDDTPAYKAGVKSKDKIIEINHESILGYNLDKVIDKMKGKEGTSIELGIVREGVKGVTQYKLKREKIRVSSVKSFLVKENYAFVRLTQFQRRSSKEIAKALNKLKKKAKKKGGVKGIILDLRSNPGGLLDEAVKVSSLFLKEGIVVSTESRDASNKNIHYVIKSMKKDLKTPLIVLVNGASASASEIVSGAIQDHKRGVIMGSQTFGKGSVQTVVQIDKDNGVKLTIAQYMTPKYRKIQALGIIPDIELEQLSSGWLDEYRSDGSYIREKDLRNHLTATIETKEEKKSRLKDEKMDREKRRSEIKNRDKKKKSSKKHDIFKKYNPSEDYQVLQAVKYLKTFKVYRDLNSTK